MPSSGGEVATLDNGFGSQFEEFFGKGNRTASMTLDKNGRNCRTTDALPRAYLGRNKVLEEIFEWRLVSKDNFYTKKLLPWKKSDDLNILVNKWTFNKQYADIVPYQGVMRFVDHTSDSMSDTMLQRGMAFILEHGFWKTELGKKHYDCNVKIIEESSTLTVYFDIIRSLLNADCKNKNWELGSGDAPQTIEDAIRRLTQTVGCFNRGADSFRKVFADAKEYLKGKGAVPDIIVIPPKSKLHITTSHASETEYNSAGSESIKYRKQGPEAITHIMGMEIHQTDVFNEIVARDHQNPLRRKFETGHIFRVMNFCGGDNLETYKNNDRFATKIPDGSGSGTQTKVTGENLFELSMRFSPDGSLSPLHTQLCNKNVQNDLRRRMQLNTQDMPRDLDMFIGYDPNTNSENPYYTMKYFGEMRDTDITDDQLRDFAKTCINHMKRFTEEEYRLIDEANQFMDALNEVDFDNSLHVSYWDAVRRSGTSELKKGDGSGVQVAENMSLSDGIFKSNSDGCIIPPTFEKDSFVVHDADGGVMETIDHTSSITKMIPLGYGSPAGLKTLTSLYNKGDYRGYDEKYLQEAAKHWNTMVKFYTIFDSLFPFHVLASENICPAYFKTNNDKTNRIYAFVLNLYGHARYPVLVTELDKETKTTLTTSYEKAMNLNDGVFGKQLLPTVNAMNLSDSEKKSLQERLNKYLVYCKNQDVRSALLEAKTINKLIKNYRFNSYKHKGETIGSVHRFILLLFFNGDKFDPSANEQGIFRRVTRAFEILLADDIDEGLQWDSELNNADDDEGVSIGRLKRFTKGGKPVDSEAQSKAESLNLNTRLCINADCFRRIAEDIQYASDSQVNNKWKQLHVSPMNIFMPSMSLLNTEDSMNNVDDKRELLLNLRYTAGPSNSNTVHSLTNSTLLHNHIKRNNTILGARKANSMEQTSDTSSGYKSRKRYQTTSGGWDEVYASVPFSNSAYLKGDITEDNRYEMEEDSESKYNIPSYLEASKVFTFGTYHGINGRHHKDDYYRSTLVSRFHHWAKDTNNVERIWVQALLTTPITLQAFKNFWAKDLIPLVSFDLYRPREQYWTGSAIVAEGGDNLGNAYHGFHEFQWGDDIVKRIHVGTYTFNFVSMVVGTHLFMILNDVVLLGDIKGGENVTFCQNVDDVDQLLRDVTINGKSIIVKMIPYNVRLPKSPQDLSGIWNKSVLHKCSAMFSSANNAVHGQSAFYYNQLYNLDKINDETWDLEDNFMNRNAVVNTVVYQGHQSIYNPVSQSWELQILDDGCISPYYYPNYMNDRSIIGKSMERLQIQPQHIYS